MMRLLFLTIFQLFAQSGSSQYISYGNRMYTTEEWEAKKRFSTVENVIAAYREACSLLDTNCVVSDASIEKFEMLFEDNARVVNDLGPEAPFSMNMRDYVSLVYSNLSLSGVEAVLTDYRYANTHPEHYPYKILENNGKVFYRYELALSKVMLNGLDENRKPYSCDKARRIPLTFVIHYYPDTRTALISDLLPDSRQDQINIKIKKEKKQ